VSSQLPARPNASTPIARLPTTSDVQWTPSHTRLQAMATMRPAATTRVAVLAASRWGRSQGVRAIHRWLIEAVSD
jgi:hypothetical protein